MTTLTHIMAERDNRPPAGVKKMQPTRFMTKRHGHVVVTMRSSCKAGAGAVHIHILDERTGVESDKRFQATDWREAMWEFDRVVMAACPPPPPSHIPAVAPPFPPGCNLVVTNVRTGVATVFRASDLDVLREMMGRLRGVDNQG